MQENVILVDEKDNEVGTEEKLTAHKEAKLHRAFSIFVLNDKGELMLQRRALTKYHCGGLWTNTCCGHPRPEESLEKATHRRLGEEMGFDCQLEKIMETTYKVTFDNDLTEYEYLHVFRGISDNDPTLNPDEAVEYKWMSLKDIKKDIEKNPKKYTPWFKMLLPKIISAQK